LKKLQFLKFFFGKTNPYGKILKTVPKGLIVTSIDVLCYNFVKFGQWEIGKIVRCLPDKKNFAWLSSSH